MRILQINKYHYLRGGSERVFFNTMRLLREHGHEVVPFAIQHPDNVSSPWDEYFVPAPELRHLGTLDRIKGMARFFNNREAARRLRRLLQKERFDVAHLHNIFNGLGLCILPVLKEFGIPVVITLHDMRFICPAEGFTAGKGRCEHCHRTLFLNCVLHNCQHSLPISVMSMLEMNHKDHFTRYDRYIDRYILLNNHYRRFFGARHPHFLEKGRVLCNFTETAPDMAPHRGDYMLFAARMTAKKGVGTLLKAAALHPDVQFKFAGTGPMEETVRKSGLKNVEALGYMSGEPLRRLVAGCSWIFVPSEYPDNNPMSLIEANTMAKPCIVAEAGGLPEMTVDGTTGLLFPPGDVTGLSDRIARAKSMSDEEYTQIAQNALVYARNNFSPERHYEELMKIYREAMTHAERR